MSWPENPSCHPTSDHWVQPKKDKPYRFCSNCGSIHPEDLLEYFRRGASLTGCHWSNDWPDRFDIHYADRYLGTWYNCHLLDFYPDHDSLCLLLRGLHIFSDIKFELRPEGKDTVIFYQAPHKDYKKTTESR